MVSIAAPPIPIFRNFPTVALVMGWFYVFLFFRFCLTKTLNYVPSTTLFMAICFLWVPVRFLLNPVHQLGAGVVGGHGISGANAYALYALAGMIIVSLGAIINTRYRVIQYMYWQSIFCFSYRRPALYLRIPPFYLVLSCRMGNVFGRNNDRCRSSSCLVSGFLVDYYPNIFMTQSFSPEKISVRPAFHNRRGHADHWRKSLCHGCCDFDCSHSIFPSQKNTRLDAFSSFHVGGCGCSSSYGRRNGYPRNPVAFARSFGMFDSKIDQASGGTASAQWRYDMWQDGIDKIKESPLIGKGIRQFGQAHEC